MKLEVLITGYPNSGTSFLCNLIVSLGKSPGKQDDLKSSDGHNRYGYYENLKLRAQSWEVLGGEAFKPWENIADFPIEINKNLEDITCEIENIIVEDNIEVYKDNALPLNYKFFPTSKIIVIDRDPEKIFESPEKGGHSKISTDFDSFLESKNKYNNLVDIMKKDRDVLIVKYENFFTDFDNEVEKILQFLSITDINKTELKKIFKPRIKKKDLYSMLKDKIFHYKSN